MLNRVLDFAFVPTQEHKLHPLIAFMLMSIIGFAMIALIAHMTITQNYVIDGMILTILAGSWMALYRL